jgi:hypothetical protein
MELIAHAVELYRANKPRKFKFVILHLANSVELILKDLLIDKGESIYKPKQPQTIGIWESFDKLADRSVAIPERPIIELLVDDRNTIQHRFGFPDAESVFYYLECVLSFFKRILTDEYGVDLADVLASHLSQDDLAFIGLAEKAGGNEHALDSLFQISPEAALIQAYNLVEDRLLRLTLKPSDENDRRRLMNLSRETPLLIRETLAYKRLSGLRFYFSRTVITAGTNTNGGILSAGSRRMIPADEPPSRLRAMSSSKSPSVR